MSYIISYLVYFFFGVLPSLLWLFFYLKKDKESEPKLLLLKVFLYGGLMPIPAIFIQEFILDKLSVSFFPSVSIFLIVTFTLMAFVEETLKFLVVKFNILNNKEFDEPIDAMIYMITSSLGFAAIENFMLLMFSANEGIVESSFYLATGKIVWMDVFQISLVRFIGATLLHSLAGAIIGFFIGLSFFKKSKGKLIIPALLLATVLHASYNLSIIKVEEGWNILTPFILLAILYLLVSFFFKKLKQIKTNHNEIILRKK